MAEASRLTNSKCERWALKLQVFDCTIAYVPGTENVIADCLSRNITACALRIRKGTRKAPVLKQVDDIACCICAQTAGADNMALCEICDRHYHLRCITPPAGAWHSPGCDPLHSNLEEMYDERPKLRYGRSDPHLHKWLLQADSSDLSPASRRLALSLVCNVQWHPTIPALLKVRCIAKSGNVNWLSNPTCQHRWDLIVRFHDILGHAGIRQTMTVFRLYYSWPGMRSDITTVLRCCDACQRRALLHPQEQFLHSPAVYGPLQHVHVDLCGPFPVGVNKKFIMVIVDYFTKVAEFCSIENNEPVTTARAFL